ncbi:conjugative transposon protein TraM [Panacibacter ginsenosidivorans]|uniref:Conjugative transposon protein TraM n=1 Tax=Panacibacter ginsenosidivorans TaxID=1813871 RepID=A0A5B8VE26_9BACT|nr:conjugative transposon protein TraM [Panacibacter ginsenosidivorans]QEC69273.1 conjugative transposon protein TraM [Panacibacter ginsenosidivorans]
MKEQSQQVLRKRKFLLVMPVLIVPFLTMAFWALGGGKGKPSATLAAKAGLNTKLPDAKLKADKGLNKMSFYDMAQKDSQKLKEAYEKDMRDLKFPGDTGRYSLRQIKTLTDRYAGQYHQEGLTGDDALQGSNGSDSRSKAAEQNLLKKLAQLEATMNKSSTADRSYAGNERRFKSYPQRPESNPDMDRLENMLHVMKSGEGDNADIRQLDTVLEKILDLQYPERVKEKQQAKSKEQKTSNAVVQKQGKGNDIAVLGEAQTATGSGFYGIADNTVSVPSQHAIEAVVAETQTIVAGAVVKLRLLNDIAVNGNLIPKNSLVYGIGKLNGERLEVDITSITYNSVLYAVGMDVYDLDGLPGVYIPGAIGRTVAKQSANSSVQSMSLSTLDPSIEAQAATAGINAAKELFSKKVKLVRVTLKAGYKVLLKIKQ